MELLRESLTLSESSSDDSSSDCEIISAGEARVTKARPTRSFNFASSSFSPPFSISSSSSSSSAVSSSGKQSAAIFIDVENLRLGWLNFTGKPFVSSDLRSFVNLLTTFLNVSLCHLELFATDPESYLHRKNKSSMDGEYQTLVSLTRGLEELQIYFLQDKVDYCVRRFQLKPSRYAKDGLVLAHQQLGTDVALGNAMTRVSFNPKVQCLILCSADSDFFETAKEVCRDCPGKTGKPCVVFGFQAQFTRDVTILQLLDMPSLFGGKQGFCFKTLSKKAAGYIRNFQHRPRCFYLDDILRQQEKYMIAALPAVGQTRHPRGHRAPLRYFNRGIPPPPAAACRPTQIKNRWNKRLKKGPPANGRRNSNSNVKKTGLLVPHRQRNENIIRKKPNAPEVWRMNTFSSSPRFSHGPPLSVHRNSVDAVAFPARGFRPSPSQVRRSEAAFSGNGCRGGGFVGQKYTWRVNAPPMRLLPSPPTSFLNCSVPPPPILSANPNTNCQAPNMTNYVPSFFTNFPAVFPRPNTVSSSKPNCLMSSMANVILSSNTNCEVPHLAQVDNSNCSTPDQALTVSNVEASSCSTNSVTGIMASVSISSQNKIFSITSTDADVLVGAPADSVANVAANSTEEKEEFILHKRSSYTSQNSLGVKDVYASSCYPSFPLLSTVSVSSSSSADSTSATAACVRGISHDSALPNVRSSRFAAAGDTDVVGLSLSSNVGSGDSNRTVENTSVEIAAGSVCSLRDENSRSSRNSSPRNFWMIGSSDGTPHSSTTSDVTFLEEELTGRSGYEAASNSNDTNSEDVSKFCKQIEIGNLQGRSNSRPPRHRSVSRQRNGQKALLMTFSETGPGEDCDVASQKESPKSAGKISINIATKKKKTVGKRVRRYRVCQTAKKCAEKSGEIVSGHVRGKSSDNVNEKSSGNLSEERSGNLSEERSGNLSEERSGNLSEERSGNLSEERSGNLSEKNSGNLSEKSLGNLSDQGEGKITRKKLSRPRRKRVRNPSDTRAIGGISRNFVRTPTKRNNVSSPWKKLGKLGARCSLGREDEELGEIVCFDGMSPSDGRMKYGKSSPASSGSGRRQRTRMLLDVVDVDAWSSPNSRGRGEASDSSRKSSDNRTAEGSSVDCPVVIE